MKGLNKTSVGLDIGSRYIKLVELKRTGDGILLNKFDIKEIPKDTTADRENLTLELISELLAENNIKARKVNISVPGQSVFIRFVKLLQVKQDKLKQTMKFEAQNQIPFPLDEVAWDWSILDKDAKTAKKAIIVAIKKNVVEDMLTRLKQIKLAVNLIDISPLSLYNCMVFNGDYREESLCALLDIGARFSNLIIFKKDNLWIRSFPIAEERIREARDQGIEELVAEIERSIEYYFMQSSEEQKADKKLDELILTGGGVLAEDLGLKLSERLNTKPRLLDPFIKLRVPKDMDEKKNQLSVAVGLALRGLVDTKIEIDFLKELNQVLTVSRQKSLYTRLSVGVAVLFIITFSFFIRKNYSVKRVKLDKIGEMLDVYSTYEPKIRKLQDEKDILEEKIATLYQTANSRAVWLGVFKTISDILPKEVWITDLSGIVSLDKSGLGRLDLSGKALSYQSVNGFVSSLKSSPGFRDVKPISSSIETDENTGEEIVKFSITMDVVVDTSE